MGKITNVVTNKQESKKFPNLFALTYPNESGLDTLNTSNLDVYGIQVARQGTDNYKTVESGVELFYALLKSYTQVNAEMLPETLFNLWIDPISRYDNTGLPFLSMLVNKNVLNQDSNLRSQDAIVHPYRIIDRGSNDAATVRIALPMFLLTSKKESPGLTWDSIDIFGKTYNFSNNNYVIMYNELPGDVINLGFVLPNTYAQAWLDQYVACIQNAVEHSIRQGEENEIWLHIPLMPKVTTSTKSELQSLYKGMAVQVVSLKSVHKTADIAMLQMQVIVKRKEKGALVRNDISQNKQ